MSKVGYVKYKEKLYKSQYKIMKFWNCKMYCILYVILILKDATKAELEASSLHEISYIFNVYDGLDFS